MICFTLQARCHPSITAMAFVTAFVAIMVSFPQVVIAATAIELRALVDAGQYDEVIEQARGSINANTDDPAMALVLADALANAGQEKEARDIWRDIMNADSQVATIARSKLGQSEIAFGDRREGRRLLTQVFDQYQQSGETYQVDALLASAEAVANLATVDPAFTEIALDVYEEAIASDAQNPKTHTAIGDYLLSRYNSEEAMAAYQDALNLDPGFVPALFGIAKSHHFDRSRSKAHEALTVCLEIRPDYVPALLLSARLAVDEDDYDTAERSVQTALDAAPDSPAALTLRAAVLYLRDERVAFNDLAENIRRDAPGYVDLYLTLAEIAAQHRRYVDAVNFSVIAVNLHPRAWRGHALLGINRMRLGDIDRGRFNLERAFQGNPFDIWTKNTLDLLDRLDDFKTEQSEHFILVASAEEIGVLAPYLLPIAERAYEFYSKMYAHQPETPIRIEVYPDHADFSVRTIGLVGIDIVGVSFGPVLAFDSPSSRAFGNFNWASVLWHEIAHTFHIDLSHGRVPRWFTEGLAVFEERRGNEGWGNDVTTGFLNAWRNGLIVPASDLDQAFLRPTYQEQIPHAYYQASLIMDMIETRHGFSAIKNMLSGFASGRTSNQMIAEILNTETSAFDKEFEAYINDRFKTQLAALAPTSDTETGPTEKHQATATATTSEYSILMQRVEEAMGKDPVDEATVEKSLLEVQTMLPDLAGSGSSYRMLADLYTKQDKTEEAIRQLKKNIAIDADDLEAHQHLARLYSEIDDQNALAAVLQRILYIQPFNAGLHERLGDIYGDRDEWQLAVSSRAAALALGPEDEIEARYRYAMALYRSEQEPLARQQLLRTLEQAPMYESALELLLELNDNVNPHEQPQVQENQ